MGLCNLMTEMCSSAEIGGVDIAEIAGVDIAEIVALDVADIAAIESIGTASCRIWDELGPCPRFRSQGKWLRYRNCQCTS